MVGKTGMLYSQSSRQAVGLTLAWNIYASRQYVNDSKKIGDARLFHVKFTYGLIDLCC